jgi:NitT/TauT family transport system ATP-binding protein
MGEPIIRITNLKKVFLQKLRPLLALENVNLEIFREEFVCILGPSGCGKSTLLNILARLDYSDEGHVEVGGLTLAETTIRMGYVFQDPRLLPWLTLEQNLQFVLEDCLGIDKEAAHDRIRISLEKVGLKGFEKYYPYQLSGGMQLRASISRALCIDPDILLMDEPFSGLDEITARTLRKELMRIWQETGKTVVFVTHNWYEASYLADRIFIMKQRPGTIVKEVKVLIDRPRSYEDPRVFEFSSNLVTDFLSIIGGDVLEHS